MKRAGEQAFELSRFEHTEVEVNQEDAGQQGAHDQVFQEQAAPPSRKVRSAGRGLAVRRRARCGSRGANRGANSMFEAHSD